MAGQAERGAPRRSQLWVLLAVGLAVVVAWLLAERNARQWWLVPEDGRVVVKRGVLFVTGKAAFQPTDPETARAYAPLVPPSGALVPAEASYEDRAALDQALFDLLASWAREDVRSQQPERMERARGWLERAARLSGLSPAQREQLRALQADTAFEEAVVRLQEGASALRRALEELRLAAESRGSVAAEAAALQRSLEPLAGSAGQLVVEAGRIASDRRRASPPAPAAGAPGAPPPLPPVGGVSAPSGTGR